jgi:hypothetical protein
MDVEASPTGYGQNLWRQNQAICRHHHQIRSKALQEFASLTGTGTSITQGKWLRNRDSQTLRLPLDWPLRDLKPPTGWPIWLGQYSEDLMAGSMEGCQ